MLRTKRENNNRLRCSKCKKFNRTRHLAKFKGKVLCSDCRMKTRLSKSMDRAIKMKYPSNKSLSILESLEKVYTIKGYIGKKSQYGYCYFPKVLIGKKIKVIIPTTKTSTLKVDEP